MSCAGSPPKRNFDTTQKVQVIEYSQGYYLHAQNDVLLHQQSLDQKLAQLNPAWAQAIDEAHSSRNIAIVSGFLQIAALAGCFLSHSVNTSLAWCGGSIAMGVVSMGYAKKENTKRTTVIKHYNEKLLER